MDSWKVSVGIQSCDTLCISGIFTGLGCADLHGSIVRNEVYGIRIVYERHKVFESPFSHVKNTSPRPAYEVQLHTPTTQPCSTLSCHRSIARQVWRQRHRQKSQASNATSLFLLGGAGQFEIVHPKLCNHAPESNSAQISSICHRLGCLKLPVKVVCSTLMPTTG